MTKQRSSKLSTIIFVFVNEIKIDRVHAFNEGLLVLLKKTIWNNLSVCLA